MQNKLYTLSSTPPNECSAGSGGSGGYPPLVTGSASGGSPAVASAASNRATSDWLASAERATSCHCPASKSIGSGQSAAAPAESD